jgi:hypothetical protein
MGAMTLFAERWVRKLHGEDKAPAGIAASVGVLRREDHRACRKLLYTCVLFFSKAREPLGQFQSMIFALGQAISGVAERTPHPVGIWVKGKIANSCAAANVIFSLAQGWAEDLASAKKGADNRDIFKSIHIAGDRILGEHNHVGYPVNLERAKSILVPSQPVAALRSHP